MIQALIGPVTGLLDQFIEDKDKKSELAHDIATMYEKHAHELNKGQLEINKTEAAHRSVWVSGWRPFIGWICGVALAWHFILSPIVVFGLAIAKVAVPDLPEFDMGSLLTILGGLLGLGGLRTFEKSKGIAK